MDFLEKYRQKINKIDDNIISLLKKRLIISKKIGEYKKRKNIRIYDKERERKIFKRLMNIAKKKNLNEKFVKTIFLAIIKNSRKNQR